MTEENPTNGAQDEASVTIDQVINMLSFMDTMLGAQPEDTTLNASDMQGLRQILSGCKTACETAYQQHLQQLKA
jgi:hypothetical protein